MKKKTNTIRKIIYSIEIIFAMAGVIAIHMWLNGYSHLRGSVYIPCEQTGEISGWYFNNVDIYVFGNCEDLNITGNHYESEPTPVIKK